MDDILRDKKFRPLFRMLLLVFLVLLVIIQIFLVPQINEALVGNPVCDAIEGLVLSLIASVLSTWVIAEFVFYIASRRYEGSRSQVLIAGEITSTLEKQIPNSREWYYRGGVGRYVRTRVLDTFARQSRESSSVHKLTLCILDPLNDSVCHAYAQYRSGVSSAVRGPKWTRLRVKCEILATILRCRCAENQNSMVHIEMYRHSTFTTFRVDVCESLALMTREDPRDPALVFWPPSRFYESCRNEIQIATRAGEEIARFDEDKDRALDNLDTSNIVDWLLELGFDDPQLSGEDLAEIVAYAKGAVNPYG